MVIWAIANQKGGVGKTTTAASLGGLLPRLGHKTLLVDLDPQASLTRYFGFEPEQLPGTVFNIFEQAPEFPAADFLLRDTVVDGLRLLPASPAMAVLDRRFATASGMGLVLKRALTHWQLDVDHVILDCPPGLGVLLVNALAASDQVIIPVQTEHLAVAGLTRLLGTMQMMQKSLQAVPRQVVVPTMYDQRTRASTVTLQRIREEARAEIFPGVIPVDTLFRDASEMGLPLTTLRPGSRGARAYSKLFEYLNEPHDANMPASPPDSPRVVGL